MTKKSDKRSRVWTLLATAGLAVALLAAAGCPPTIPPFEPGTVDPKKLPSDVERLLKFAQQRLALGRAKGFNRLYHADALVALDKARKLAPKRREVLLLGARVARALGERADNHKLQFKWAELGLAFTRLGRKHYPKEVAFHYYHGALMGLRVDAYRASALSAIPEIREAITRAMKLDRRFDHAGPLRVLGSLLASVPETRPFNGDLDKGLKLLGEAMKLAPDFPLNHFFFGQALAKDEENDRAAEHFGRVICAPLTRDWDALLAGKYKQQARKALRKLKRSDAPKCP